MSILGKTTKLDIDDDKKTFDYEEFKRSFASRFKESKQLLGKDGALTPLIKEFLEEALVGQLESHIDSGEDSNRKSGKLPKTLKTNFGHVDIQTPRDRNGTFEPERVGQFGAEFARKYPVLLIHGRKDPIFSIQTARNDWNKYQQEGHPARLIEVADLGHAWASGIQVNDSIGAFIAKNPLR